MYNVKMWFKSRNRRVPGIVHKISSAYTNVLSFIQHYARILQVLIQEHHHQDQYKYNVLILGHYILELAIPTSDKQTEPGI